MQLVQRQADGSTLREHLLAAMAQGAAPDARLSATVPAGGQALWDAFCSMSSGRQAGLGGAGPIPPSEVLAWQQLQGVRFTPWELDTLRAMDDAALGVLADQRRAEAPKGVQ